MFGLILMVFFGVIFLVGGVCIGREVEKNCQEAREKHQLDDCVTALIMKVEDQDENFGDRNRAIWALGQLGDNRALATLERNYSGIIKDKEAIDQAISQYELKKAIELLKGGKNITAWLWRKVN